MTQVLLSFPCHEVGCSMPHLPYLGEPFLKPHHGRRKLNCCVCVTNNNTFQILTNWVKLPESTVKTAAKALSLSPSMTLLVWTSSKHMRLNPTTSRMMYSISEISDSHSIPAKHRHSITITLYQIILWVLWCYTLLYNFCFTHYLMYL